MFVRRLKIISIENFQIETIVEQHKKPMIVLLLDRSEYPPMGSAKKYFTRITPIDCSNNNPTFGSAQFQDIVELIGLYLAKQQNTSPNLDQSNGRNNSLNRRKKMQDNNSRGEIDDDYGEADQSSELPTIRRESYANKSQDQRNRSRKKSTAVDEPPSYYNPDGPKLPSLYRQKLSNKY